MNRRPLRWILCSVAIACGPKAPPAEGPAGSTVAPTAPALHVRCFEGLDGHAWHNACTLSSGGVTIELGAAEVMPTCAVRGLQPPRVVGGWPTSVEAWTPSCYGAGDSFVCGLRVEASGRAGGSPADVVVFWSGTAADAERLTMPTFDAPLSPFPTRPDAALDTRGAVEVSVWPASMGKPSLVDASCAAGQALP